jgi:hypothetical protein
MLRIRPAQRNVFQSVFDADFVRRVARHLREHRPDVLVRFPDARRRIKNLPDATLERLIALSLSRARSYGMKLEAGIASFISLMFVIAPNFDDHPLIKFVMTNRNVPPDERVDELIEQLADETWAEAAKLYDPGAWGRFRQGGRR